MRTFRAIIIAKNFREHLAKVEDESDFEHSKVCFWRHPTWDWRAALRHNHPHKPCPGLLWRF